MLDFNTLFLSSDIKAQKENTDMIIRSWKSEHEKEYAIFIERIDNITHGDLSILYDLFLLVEECVPPAEESHPIPFVSKPITEYHDDIWNMMPFVVVGLLLMMSPEYLSPLYDCIQGQIIMTVCVGLTVVSYVLSKKIADIAL